MRQRQTNNNREIIQAISYMAIPGLNRGGTIYDKSLSVKETTIDKIVKIVCDWHKIKPQDLWKETRKREIVIPRQRAHYFCRKLTTKSIVHIGRKVGGMNHATVLHSIRNVENLMEVYPFYKKEMKELYENITGSGKN